MPDLASFGSGLVRYQVLTQYLRGLRHGFFGIAREFYTAGLAATTGMDLCLDNAAASTSCKVDATFPTGTGTPYRFKISLAWYSWIFTRSVPNKMRPSD